MRRWGKRLLLAAAALLLAAAAGHWLLPLVVPCPPLPAAENTLVLDRRGEPLGFAACTGFRSAPLPEDALPPALTEALIRTEDKRFRHHDGLDPLALVRALWGHLRGNSRSGASTLTMQLAKMTHPGAPRTLRAKLREALQARRLEMRYGKDEILRAYLDRADFGNLCRGAQAAAFYYFRKPAQELSAEEATMLCGLLQAPSRLNPRRHPERALRRRDALLRRRGLPTAAPLVLAEPLPFLPPTMARSGGQLTLDARLQAETAAIAREELDKLRDRNVSQAAVVVLDNRSAELLVCLPTAYPDSPRGGALDGTATPRSAGSSLKPFVYAMAFAHGAWPGTVLADVPTLYPSADGVQAPTDYNDRYMGPITIRRALACSQNVPAMEALNRFGGVRALGELLERVGIPLRGAADDFGLGLAIGNAPITLTELAQAYSVLARGGAALPLQRRLPLRAAEPVRLLPAETCYQLAEILSDPTARAGGFGQAPALRFSFRCAAKTGTSSDFRDNWCVGFTREYTVAVWCGNFDNSSMKQVSGLSGAGPIFHRVTEMLHRDTPASFPEPPDTLQRVGIDTRTGLLPRDDTPAAFRATEWATEAQRPTESGLYDAEGRALLDSRYTDWLAGRPALRRFYALRADDPGQRRPNILIPASGSVVVLDRRLRDSGRLMELSSTLPPATVQWSSPTLRITQRNGQWYAELTPGRHLIRAATPDAEVVSVFDVLPDGGRKTP